MRPAPLTVIGVYNIKGGVGKTATAINLAYLAAEEGQRTLVWDLDPQVAATYYFRIRPKVEGGGKALIRGKHALDAMVKGTDFENLGLLPADFSFRNLDLALEDAKQPTKQLSRLLMPLGEGIRLHLPGVVVIFEVISSQQSAIIRYYSGV